MIRLLRVLVTKDLRRVARNPVPWSMFLVMPVVITALIGLAFGRSNQPGGLGTIKLAVVDEDDSSLTRFLRGALSQGDSSKYIAASFLPRAEALQEITNNRFSAVLIIPKDFTHDYLRGHTNLTLELIKNPSQAFYPAIVEEFLGVAVSGLNAVARNVQAAFPAWSDAIDRPEGFNTARIVELVKHTGDRFESVREYIVKPRILYTQRTVKKEPEITAAGKSGGGGGGGGGGGNNSGSTFAYLLPGLAALFLLFQADQASRDLYREMRFGTFDRIRSFNDTILALVVGKALFVIVVVILSATILLGGGSLVFGFRWQHPLPLAALVVTYGMLGAGLMSFIASIAGKEKRADVLNSMMAMGLGLAGGCMFPLEQMPAVLRDHIAPKLPTYWFVEAARHLQFSGVGSGGGTEWVSTALKCAIIGLVLLTLAAFIFQRRLSGGRKT